MYQPLLTELPTMYQPLLSAYKAPPTRLTELLTVLWPRITNRDGTSQAVEYL